jgi:hypothetical protein
MSCQPCPDIIVKILMYHRLTLMLLAKSARSVFKLVDMYNALKSNRLYRSLADIPACESDVAYAYTPRASRWPKKSSVTAVNILESLRLRALTANESWKMLRNGGN